MFIGNFLKVKLQHTPPVNRRSINIRNMRKRSSFIMILFLVYLLESAITASKFQYF